MRCPYCKIDDDRVVDSRQVEGQFSIRRRRECLKCGRRYTTYERIETSVLKIVKKDGRREPFDYQKLLTGLAKACEKRPVASETLEEIARKIEADLVAEAGGEVPSHVIGEGAMTALRGVDQVAYVRFASVYREFKDVAEFVSELKALD